MRYIGDEVNINNPDDPVAKTAATNAKGLRSEIITFKNITRRESEHSIHKVPKLKFTTLFKEG